MTFLSKLPFDFSNAGSIQHLMELEEQEKKLQTENQVS